MNIFATRTARIKLGLSAYILGFANKMVKNIWIEEDLSAGITVGILTGILWPFYFANVSWIDIITNKDRRIVRLEGKYKYWCDLDSQYLCFEDEIDETLIEIQNMKDQIAMENMKH